VIAAPHDGTVEQLRAVQGAGVAMDEVLAVVSVGDADGPADGVTTTAGGAPGSAPLEVAR
jgi:acetyl-CoA/propionyl-CoA carboxylase biotin carboxyl carrier protein